MGYCKNPCKNSTGAEVSVKSKPVKSKPGEQRWSIWQEEKVLDEAESTPFTSEEKPAHEGHPSTFNTRAIVTKPKREQLFTALPATFKGSWTFKSCSGELLFLFVFALTTLSACCNNNFLQA